MSDLICSCSDKPLVELKGNNRYGYKIICSECHLSTNMFKNSIDAHNEWTKLQLKLKFGLDKNKDYLIYKRDKRPSLIKYDSSFIKITKGGFLFISANLMQELNKPPNSYYLLMKLHNNLFIKLFSPEERQQLLDLQDKEANEEVESMYNGIAAFSTLKHFRGFSVNARKTLQKLYHISYIKKQILHYELEQFSPTVKIIKIDLTKLIEEQKAYDNEKEFLK